MSAVEVIDTGIVRHVWLARPERRNAMNVAMVEGILAAARGAADEGLRVLVLRGRGGHFCSGGDVSDMAAAAAKTPQGEDPIALMNLAFGEMISFVDRLPLAVIAVCEGSVMGGGFGLACVADITLAVDGARFRLPETSLGVTPAQIMPFLVQRMGTAWSRRLAVTGETLSAEQSVSVGVAHEVVTGDAVEARVGELVTSIRAAEPRALAATKELVHRVAAEGVSRELLQKSAEMFAGFARSEQAQQGFAARMAKRPAPWAEG